MYKRQAFTFFELALFAALSVTARLDTLLTLALFASEAALLLAPVLPFAAALLLTAALLAVVLLAAVLLATLLLAALLATLLEVLLLALAELFKVALSLVADAALVLEVREDDARALVADALDAFAAAAALALASFLSLEALAGALVLVLAFVFFDEAIELDLVVVAVANVVLFRTVRLELLVVAAALDAPDLLTLSFCSISALTELLAFFARTILCLSG